MTSPVGVTRLSRAACALSVLVTAACSTPRPLEVFNERLATDPGQGVLISPLPRLPGAAVRDELAAMNPLFLHWKRPAISSPRKERDALDPERALPSAEVMMQLAESRGLWAFAFYGSMDSLRARLVAGVPVLVMFQDDPHDREKRRYALAVGFNEAAREIVVDEGKRRLTVMSYRTFNEGWRPVRQWMMVVAPPERADWSMSMRERMALARFWERQGEWGEAIREYESARQLAPRSVELRLALALAFQRSANAERAEALYREVLAEDDLRARAANNLAVLLVETGGDLAEAERWARRALTLEPSNPYYLDTLGHILVDAGRAREAADVLERARHRSRSLPMDEQRQIVERLLQAYMDSDQAHLARQVLQDHRARDPGFAWPAIGDP